MTTSTATLLTGIGLGIGLGYLLDPDQGRRRRAIAGDRAVRMARRGGRLMVGTVRDASNRIIGVKAKLSRGEALPGQLDDDTLVARVRTALGRATSHPGAVHIMVEDGVVRLDGAALEGEVEHLLSTIRDVEGVMAIDNRLRVRASAEDVPGLQGAGKLPTPNSQFKMWTRLTAAATAASAVAALAYRIRRQAGTVTTRVDWPYFT